MIEDFNNGFVTGLAMRMVVHNVGGGVSSTSNATTALTIDFGFTENATIALVDKDAGTASVASVFDFGFTENATILGEYF